MAKRNQTIRLSIQKKCPIGLSRGRDSVGRRPPLSRCPPGGSLQPCCSPRPDGRTRCFRRPAPDVSKLPPGPVNENSQLLTQPAVNQIFAERARFELAIPFWGTHAFQACLFSHSSISPIRVRRPMGSKPDCKGNHFFRKCKCPRPFFPSAATKSGCGRCSRDTLPGSG